MKAIVLLSGGLDSAVCLAQAVKKHQHILAITFDYGQKANVREIAAARLLAQHYQVQHEVIKLDFLEQITQTALVSQTILAPEPTRQDLDDAEVAKATAAQVWVPNRNGLFINIAGCFADAQGYHWIIAGFNKEEAATFPDNTPDFQRRCTAALELSTRQQPRVVSYTEELDKQGIVRLGQQLAVPFQYVWSCYYGNQQMCGRCESCQRFIRAFEQASVAFQRED